MNRVWLHFEGRPPELWLWLGPVTFRYKFHSLIRYDIRDVPKVYG